MKHIVTTRISFADDELFNKYLPIIRDFFVPALKFQTCKNFDLCLIARECHKDALEEICKDIGVNVFSVVGNVETYNKYILKQKYEIQTRHDCDDWMAPDYIEKIQNAYVQNKDKWNEFLIYAQPTKFDYITKKEYFMSKYSNKKTPMFLSLCQNNPCTKSIYQEKHSDFPNIVPNAIYLGEGLVKWNIHGNNSSDKDITIHDISIDHPKLTVITSVFGNLEMMKECMPTWFPLMSNWELIVYDQKVSSIDGTDIYVDELHQKYNFTLVRDNKIRSHPDAINFLLKEHVKTEWVLHFDSDIVLLNKKLYTWANSVIKAGDKKLCGIVEHYNRSKLKEYPETTGFYTLHLPRAAPYVMLFNKKFMDERGIDFSSTIIEGGSLKTGTAQIFQTNELLSKTAKIRVTGDTGWKLFYETHGSEKFQVMPIDVRQSWEHKEAASRTWMRKNKKQIEELKKSMDEMPKNIDLWINNEVVNFNRIYPERSRTGIYYEDSAKRYFLKMFDKNFIDSAFAAETKGLNVLNKYEKHFPKIILLGTNYIVMSHCGEMISEKNLPLNVYEQVDEILDILKNENLRHLDIKVNEVLVKESQLYLVDFSFSRLNFSGSHGPRPNDDLELNSVVDTIVSAANRADIRPRNKYFIPPPINIEESSFTKYIVKNRIHDDASQSQVPTLFINDDIASFGGYQEFNIIKNGDLATIEIPSKKLKVKCDLISAEGIIGDSLLDLGCSNGGVGLWFGINSHVKSVYLYDHDQGCINNLTKLSEWMPKKFEMHPKKYEFSNKSDDSVSFDYVITLATLHWFYSATTDMGCLNSIVRKIKNMTKKALFVEWVNVDDPMLQMLNHTDMNKKIHKTPYSRKNFIMALETNFNTYKKLGNTTNTRELFVAYI